MKIATFQSFAGSTLLLATLISAVWAHSPAVSAGFLGQSLGDVKETEFFKDFQFRQASSQSLAGRQSLTTFNRPSAALNLTADASGRVTYADLFITRSLIDSPASSESARNMAVSFLRQGLSQEDRVAVGDLVSQIEHSDNPSRAPATALKPESPQPLTPTAGYLTFVGKQHFYEQRMQHCRLKLQNITYNQTQMLRLTIAPLTSTSSRYEPL